MTNLYLPFTKAKPTKLRSTITPFSRFYSSFNFSAKKNGFQIFILLIITFLGSIENSSAQQYFGGSGTWTGSVWSNTNSGPYTTLWSSGSAAVFNVAAGTITGATTAFSGINANENVTVTAGGTLSTGGTVATITIATGKTFDFAGQNLSTAAGTGFIKTGGGTLISANVNAYPGGFTLNAGTMIAGNTNAMGNGGALNINGGVLAAGSARNITSRYSAINIGGDFTFGNSSNAANISFADNVVLGNTTRTINLDGTANTSTYSLSGMISGTVSAGIVLGTTLGNGILVLSNPTNTYPGATIINGGTLSISSIANGGVNSGIGSSGNAAGNLILGGGTLLYSGATASTDRNFTLTNGTSSTLNIVSATTLTLTGAGVGTGSLIKSGAGTLQLNKSGGTTIPATNNITVSGGTLQISSNQILNNLDIGAGNLIVDGGVTLTVNGTITVSGTGSVTGTIIYGPSVSLVYSSATSRTTGPEWPTSAIPVNLTLNTAGTNISLNENKAISNNLSINNTAVLTGTGFSITVSGDWSAASAGAYTGSTNPSSAVILNGSGIRTFAHTGGATFRNLSFTGTGNYIVSNDIIISVNTLTISGGTVTMGTNSLSGSGTLNMNGGLLQSGKLNTNINPFPELDNNNTLSGGTIELNGAGAQVLRGARTYINLSFSNTGTKTLTSSPTSITGTVTIANSAVLDVSNNSMGGAGTNLVMTGTSRFITSGTGTKPAPQGTYTLGTGTTIEFGNTGGTQEDIRLTPTYGNIDVSGSNVGLSGASSSVTLQTGTTFTVKGGGIFNVKNTNGFSGGSTAVSSTNSPGVVLEANSTINYNGTAQTITNAINVGLGTANYSNLILSGSGAKSAPATLSLTGNFTRTSTAIFTHNNGTVSFDGTLSTTQSYNVTDSIDFYKIIVNNTNGGLTTTSGGMGITDRLTLNVASKLIFGSGNISIKSTASKTATISQLTLQANIDYTGGSGRFRIERYILNPRKWQLLSVPTTENVLTSTFKTNWMENSLAPNDNTVSGYGMIITKATAASGSGFDANSNSASVKFHDPVTNGYTAITNTTDPIARASGYFAYVRGDRTSLSTNSAAAQTTLRTTGKIQDGANVSVSDPAATDTRFQAIGNPYASAVNLKTIGFTNIAGASGGFTGTVYVWDPTIAGTFGVGKFITLQYNGVSGDYDASDANGLYTGPARNNFIQSGQAFFVQSAGGTGSVTFKETNKDSASQTVSFSAGIPQLLRVNMYTLDNGTDPNSADGALVLFNDNMSNAADGYDATKMFNNTDNLSFKTSGKYIAIENRHTIIADDTLHLNISNMRIMNYRFVIAPENLDAHGLYAFLKDSDTGIITPVALNSNTTVNFSIDNNAASSVANRFMMVFNPASVLAIEFTYISAKRQADGSATVKWLVSDELNTDRYYIEESNNATSFRTLGSIGAINNSGGNAEYLYSDVHATPAAHYYRIKTIGQNGEIKYSGIAKVTALYKEPALSVNPNPVKDNIVKLNLVNTAAGLYRLQIFDNQRRTVYSGNLTTSGNREVKEFSLSKTIAAGKYELFLVNKDGIKQHTNFLIMKH